MSCHSQKTSVLRITGGILNGRTIPVPPGIIRPSMNKMRKSVFSIIGDLSGASFLDLFSGSGIIALEAASRGAVYLEAVESDKKKQKTLISNSSLATVRIHCHIMPVELFIKRSLQAFDYIFCDPPFAYKYKNELLSSIALSALMNETSLLMIHREKKETQYLYCKNNILALQYSRYYGNSVVDFLYKDKNLIV